MKRWKRIFQASKKQKKAELAILRSDKIDFKPKMVMRQRRLLYNDKGLSTSRRYSSHNIYALNIRTLKYIKKTLTDLMGEINDTIIVEDSIYHCQQRIGHPDRKPTRKCWN